MTHSQKTSILCVDDEPNVLAGLKRELYDDFDVTTAVGGAEGVAVFEQAGPFPIVISDLRMPGMDGVNFLGKIRQANADSVRILLTGQADLDSAIAAVNEGYIFRFLTKPCPSGALVKALRAAEVQYKLVTAERVLLEQTLQGSIKTLTDILALANPELFSKANRIKLSLKKLLDILNIQEKWPIEVAAMLSQISTITLPDETIQKLNKGEPLKADEEDMLTRLPAMGEKLLSHIPRLEPVREILLYQEKHYDGSGFPKDNKQGEQIPLGARILKIMLDYDQLAGKAYDTNYIFSTLSGRKGWYDETLLKEIALLYGSQNTTTSIQEVHVAQLSTGMILTEDVFTLKGIRLVRGGIEVTPTLLERIRNIAKHGGIREPLRITNS